MDKFHSLKEFEDDAPNHLSPIVLDYFSHGTDPKTGVQGSEQAFKKLRICPRVLRNVSDVDISTTVLGEKVSMPLGVSAMAHQKFAHLEGECANAKAAEEANVIFTLSVFSNFTIQEVARAAPMAIKWMQIFIFKDRNFVRHLIQTVEKAGFKGIVVTVDHPIMPKGRDHKVDVLPKTTRYAIFDDYFATRNVNEEKKSVSKKFIDENVDDSLTWDDIAWLKSLTSLPIILKGILSSEDALLGVKHGASAILVSNHGGRMIDGVPATIEALPGIVKAVGDKAEIYLDGGVKRGTDVYKALALGAKMVFIGRPTLWGLACGGKKGVRSVLEIMRREISELFSLTGCSNVRQVTENMVMHESIYSRL